MAFLQADLVHADICNHALRIDGQRLAVGQLVLHDETHRVRGDAQTPSHFGFVGADEHPQHVFFKAIGVTGFFAFERRQKIMTMMAMRAAMKNGLIAEKSRLPENIEIAYHACFANVQIQ